TAQRTCYARPGCLLYREAVAQHSPGSRSAPRGPGPVPTGSTPKGLDTEGAACVQPLRGRSTGEGRRFPGGRCATPGCAVQPIRGRGGPSATVLAQLVP